MGESTEEMTGIWGMEGADIETQCSGNSLDCTRVTLEKSRSHGD